MEGEKGLFRAMAEGIFKGTIRNQYPHMELPSCLYASVTSRQELRKPEFHYEYSLTILDSGRSPDPRFPVIPRVKCRQKYEVGELLAVLLMNGTLDLYIAGSVVPWQG